MKHGFAPLLFALALFIFSAFNWAMYNSKNVATLRLASNIEFFLEDQRGESQAHLLAQKQARELSDLLRSPNRLFLIVLSLIVGVLYLALFFRNPTGQAAKNRLIKFWTWRP